jgi:hypothetical protein
MSIKYIEFNRSNSGFCLCFFGHYWPSSGAEIAKSVEQLATGSTVRFRFLAVQDFPLLRSVKTGSGAHPASYPLGSRGFFPWSKAAGA